MKPGSSPPNAAEIARAAASPVPDWCNVGMTLRVTVAVNLLYVALTGAAAVSLSNWLNEWLRMATVIEPVLIGSLAVGCLVRRISFGLPFAIQIVLALAIPALLTLALEHGAAPLIDASHAGRDALYASAICAATMYWARLRQRAYSPALAEAQLQALQARIRPHFLFNSLNAVLGLMRSDPKRAETVLEDLSDLFRALLRDARERIPLRDEVALCRQYLQIEALRLGERLAVQWHVDERALQVLVPALLLQPLVENAVHHGIEPANVTGMIEISITRNGDYVAIRISNPWLGNAIKTGKTVALKHKEADQTTSPETYPTLREGHGIGLENVRQRLTLIHDLEAKLETEVRAGRFTVSLIMPTRRF